MLKKQDEAYVCPVCGEPKPVPSLVKDCKHKSLYQYTESQR